LSAAMYTITVHCLAMGASFGSEIEPARHYHERTSGGPESISTAASPRPTDRLNVKSTSS
jgi:hypothetical protein